MSLGYTLNCSIRCSARQHDKYAKAQVASLSDSFVSYSSLYLSPSLFLVCFFYMLVFSLGTSQPVSLPPPFVFLS